MRATPRSGWVACIDPEESIASTMFDVAMLPAAPSTSLYLYVEPEGFGTSLSNGNRTPSRLHDLPATFFASSLTSLFLSISIFLSRSRSLTSSLVFRTHIFAYAHRKSANAPDADVGPSLIPRLDAHDRVFGLNPLLRDEHEWGRHATSFSLLYLLTLSKISAIFCKFCQLKPFDQILVKKEIKKKRTKVIYKS